MTLYQKATGRTPGEEFDLVIQDLARQQITVARLVRKKPKIHSPSNQQIGPQLFRHLCEVANTTSALISPLVGADYCAVTIKLLWREKSRTVVHTLLRDARSYRDRGSYQPPNNFDISENTAFKTLIGDQNPDRLFLSNNLRLDAALGKYTNVNERWKEFYNSTAVVRINHPTQKNVVIGFLCADRWSWKPTAEAEKLLPDILRKLSAHVYNTLELIVPSNSHGQKPIGFQARTEQLSPVDTSFQLGFQSTLETYRIDFDRDFQRREMRNDPLLAGVDHLSTFAPDEGNEMSHDTITKAIIDAASRRNPRIQALKQRFSTMTSEEFAKRLKPIARHNAYAKQILERARKKRLAK